MTITTTIEVRAVVTVVESPGQTGARQADGAPLEPSFEREARIASVELPDAEGVGLPWRDEIPRKAGAYWCQDDVSAEPFVLNISQSEVLQMQLGGEPFGKLKRIAGPLPLPGHATPAHLPVESLSPTDAQRIMRLAERQLSEPNDQTYEQ